MCKLNKKNDSRFIDPCMQPLLQSLSGRLYEYYKTLACCCGHGKYPMTLIIKHDDSKYPIEIFSNKCIPRKKKFYKKDKEGYYYIPETIEGETKNGK